MREHVKKKARFAKHIYGAAGHYVKSCIYRHAFTRPDDEKYICINSDIYIYDTETMTTK